MKKHSWALIAAAILSVSCNNAGRSAKTPPQPEISAETLAAARDSLSKDVLLLLDSLAQDYVAQTERYGSPLHLRLSEDEKYVQPDYLLDPSVVNNLVTKNQKVNALAVLCIERLVRLEYGMPLSETEAAISKLALDLDHPVGGDELKNLSAAEIAKREYQLCKERGDLRYFWMFNNGIYNEMIYLMSQDPGVYLRDVTREEWTAFQKRNSALYEAVAKLAQHDDDFARIQGVVDNYSLLTDSELRESAISLDRARKLYRANREAISGRRAEFLK